MPNLSEIVLIAGPNGGGKSRVLQAVRDNCNRMHPEPPGKNRRDLAAHRSELARAEEQLELEKAKVSPDAAALAHWQKELQRTRRFVEEKENLVLGIPVMEPDLVPPPLVVDLTIFDANFQDCGASAASTWSAAQSQIAGRLDLSMAIQFGPSAVFALLANNLAASSPIADMSQVERESYQKKLADLNELADRILGSRFTLGRLEDGPRIFGHPLGNAEMLSAGQRMLLAVLYVLFFQADADKDVVILWDEPENHLHPDAVIKILESLRKACPKAQMWIATHSVHILAHFQEHGIWFAREGEVTRGGKVAEKVLGSLLGGDEQLDKLTEFLAQPAQRALRLFASQCLIEPGAVDTLPGDPQTTQIFELLSNGKNDPMKVLDFGAGKGRLLSELISHDGALDRIHYFACDYEPNASDKAAVVGHLLAAYGESESKYVVGPAQTALEDWSAKFDVVVMCNVLHEIPPEDWTSLFGPAGAIAASLNDAGHLLVVEDYALAAGERAHRFGFLLLDEDELATLFGSSGGEIETVGHAKQEYRDRLMVHVVPKKALLRMHESTVLASLEALRDRSFKQARFLHESNEKTAKAGHALAVAAHQHLNALLAIEALRPKVVAEEAMERVSANGDSELTARIPE